MTHIFKYSTMLLPFVLPAFLTACGPSQADYDALHAQNQQLQQQNQQLQQQVATDQAHMGNLRGALAYEVNSDLLFRSGSWELSDDGKTMIGRVAQKLAPTQQLPLVVN